MTSLLEVRNLTFQYPSYPELEFPQLFSGLELTVRRGEFVVVLGPPETGKTTLSRILCGLQPRYGGGDFSGSVAYDGHDIVDTAPYELLRCTGCVFQNPDEQIVSSRCDSEVAFALESLNTAPETMQRQVADALAAFGLEGFDGRDPQSLSGGEKRKLMLASLYAQNPALWLLDETFDELDPPSRRTIVSRLRDHVEKSNGAVLYFASKFKPELRAAADRVLLLGEGVLRECAAEDEDGFFRHGFVISAAENPEKGTKSTSEKVSTGLRVEKLRYRYPGNSDFLLDIGDFLAEPDTVTVIAGPNGCGKTTLAKVLAGVLEPESGGISWGGAVWTAAERNRNSAYLFQNPDYQIFLDTVDNELLFGVPRRQREQAGKRCPALRARFGLPSGRIPPSLLSFGTRKMLQGAVYHVLEKKVYIIDEADSGLTFSGFQRLLNALKTPGAVVIVITHDADICRIFGERLYLLDRGCIARCIGKGDEDADFNAFLDGASV